MPTSGPHAVACSIDGPIERACVPAVCDRLCTLLAEAGAEAAVCDLAGVPCDAVTVDALARLSLAARRRSCRIQFRNACPELCALVELIGLTDVLAPGRVDASPGSDPGHV